jgi:enoyl-CoA hydratase/carnithine racemase
MSAQALTEWIRTERGPSAGLITLDRPAALNALSLSMVRELTRVLRGWLADPGVALVALRGSNKAGAPGAQERWFGHFCAGGDIRFFHDAALAGDASLEDFFTEEYALNHLIQTSAKPIVAFMDGVVMGGGMGLCQGIARRVVTEKTKMAMPETKIGLFPDVGGGHFLSRCPGHVGEYLALTGEVIGADEAIGHGLADVRVAASEQARLWQALAQAHWPHASAALGWLDTHLPRAPRHGLLNPALEAAFGQPSVLQIVQTLEAASDAWSHQTAVALRQRSPLMLHVTLEQIRRARSMRLADALRMERDMVWHCFHKRPMRESETVEGIRALAVDKDHAPQWNPPRIEDVDMDEVQGFFHSPWSADTHPLRDL